MTIQSRFITDEKGLLELIDEAQKTSSALYLPPHMRIFKVTDDVMSPELLKGDHIIADTLQQNINEGIYALQYQDKIAVRRLQPCIDGIECRLICMNEAYTSELLPMEKVQSAIIGRVVFAEKRYHLGGQS